MPKVNMKEVSTDPITQALRRDFLTLMIREGNSIDFCSFVAEQINSNKKTVASKFQSGVWTTIDLRKSENLTGGDYLKGAYKQLSKK